MTLKGASLRCGNILCLHVRERKSHSTKVRDTKRVERASEEEEDNTKPEKYGDCKQSQTVFGSLTFIMSASAWCCESERSERNQGQRQRLDLLNKKTSHPV